MLGEKACEEERELVKEHKAGHVQGTKEIPVIFEEADGGGVCEATGERPKKVWPR